jgi:DNA-binding NtrC family response regulator
MRADPKDGWTGCSLLDEVLRYEHDLIAQAMAADEGRITDAARRLQTKHQTLRHIIDGRHKDTLGKEYPARSRRIKGR